MQHFLILLSKAILKIAIDKTLERALPGIYEKLDTRIPNALTNGAAPELIKSEIEFAIGQTTRKYATKDMIDIVTTLYDPIQNAKRLRSSAR